MNNTEILSINDDLKRGITEITQGLALFHGALVFTAKLSNTQIVYIAGKVTGLPESEYRAKFQRRKEELLAAGYLVINPCDFLSASTSWRDAMAICLLLLPMASLISLLHDWQDSEGATIEKELADKLGIKVLSL